ncbi:MAG TPA: hypothetical protein VEJ39_03825 [Candidatus Acidoferrales bacterium]|nr:hypothetical protein [Candidatus Acidoferrales bacterium]
MAETHEYNSEAFERDDIELVKMFLSQFKDDDGNSYFLAARPDIEERTSKAVEAIAISPNGRTLAIEHTFIQPFEGQRSDDVPFLAVFEGLRNDASLRIPNRFIDVFVPAFAVPKGVDWSDIAKRVREWFTNTANTFPSEGECKYAIPNCGFELNVVVQTLELDGSDGIVLAGRILPSGDQFDAVLDKAITQKVPKLVATPAAKHILLLEDGGVSTGFAKVGKGLDARTGTFEDLKKVDAVWIVYTMEWKSRGNAMFVRVWPKGVGPRFWIHDARFSQRA